MNKNVTPLKIWIWVAVTFCLFQLIVIIYYNKPKNDKRGDLWFSSQLNDIKSDFTTQAKSAYHVIIIGSSLVGNAVDCPDEVNNILSNYPTKNILLNKIWQPHDPFQYLVKNRNLINELLQIKPDLVCIQTELAAIRYEKTEKYFYSDFQGYIEDLAKKNTSIFSDVFSKGTTRLIKCEDNFIDNEVVDDTMKYIPAKRYVKNNAEIQFVCDALNKLKNAGIKIVLVDIPRPRQVEQVIYTGPFLQELNLLFDMYEKKYGVTHWSYTGGPMYFNVFYDGGHLNRDGRHLFTKNLLEKIIKEMGDKK